MALVLRALHEELGDTAAGAAVDRALQLVRPRFDGTRWGELFELMGGNAGIGLGALLAGDAELAVLAMEPYLRTAEQTPAGVHWAHRTGIDSRLHHISHGTLGIVLALARVGEATGRADLVELALAGAADVVARRSRAGGLPGAALDPPVPTRCDRAHQLRLVPRPGRPLRPRLKASVMIGWAPTFFAVAMKWSKSVPGAAQLSPVTVWVFQW
ncbi:lanthionine synthetase LanC family protein [Streptomyces sp. NPDC007856]|uniref:lanthionine synthetase LanC family protein n=1 Tax=Streptomyces sp. NPDC007856 TaxID=3364781 RepID=UPI00367814D1